MMVGGLNPRGPVAVAIDDLWRLMLWLGVATFVLFAVLLVVALVRPAAGAADRELRHGHRFLVGGGLVLPSVVIGLVFVATVATMQALAAPPTNPLVIEVTGHRWWWEVEYPDTGVEVANEIVVPTDRPVELRLTSADVIHSFWVPSLAGKIDALPDGVNRLVFEAPEPGEYRGACAEFCGLQHAKMGVAVVALPPEDFERWLLNQAEPAVTNTGLPLFLDAGCGDCHTFRGTDAAGDTAPDLTHVASRDTIGALTVLNERSQLIEWIADPHEIKQGVDMPAVDLDTDDLEQLADFLEGLE